MIDDQGSRVQGFLQSLKNDGLSVKKVKFHTKKYLLKTLVHTSGLLMTTVKMHGFSVKTWCLAVCLLFFLSCAPYRQNMSNPSIIENVPFIEQSLNDCGVVSVWEVLNYWGYDIKYEDIRQVLLKDNSSGVLSIDILLFAKTNSIQCQIIRGDFNILRKHILNRIPVIVLLKTGPVNENSGFYNDSRLSDINSVGHYIVVAGFYDNGIVYHGAQAPFQNMGLETLKRYWEGTDFCTIILKPII